MKKHVILGMLMVVISLALFKTTKAQTPVDRLIRENWNLVERQGKRADFLLERFRYRSRSDYYLGRRHFEDRIFDSYENWRHYRHRSGYYYDYRPNLQRCFYNPTRYYVDIYPIGGWRIARLAPGQSWLIIGSSFNYHTSIRFNDGSWRAIVLPVVLCR